MNKPITQNRNKLNLFLDILLVVVFAVEMETRFTGLRIHELLGLGFSVAILIHLLLHWDWVVAITKQFFRKLLHESRLNYVLNALLLIDMIVIAVSGILISRTLGLNFDGGRALQPIHIMASYLSLVLIGLHVALHWKWIITHVQKYLIPPRAARPVSPAVQTTDPLYLKSSVTQKEVGS